MFTKTKQTKNKPLQFHFQMSKIPNVVLWGPLRRKFRSSLKTHQKSNFKFDKFRLQFVEEVVLWKLHFRKLTSAPNYTKVTLNATRPKVPHICWTTVRESQRSRVFALRSLVIQIIRFLHRENLKFSIKKRYQSKEIGNSKCQKSPNAVWWGPLKNFKLWL